MASHTHAVVVVIATSTDTESGSSAVVSPESSDVQMPLAPLVVIEVVSEASYDVDCRITSADTAMGSFIIA